MKPTGVVRRIDELGRIVIPKEIRRSLRIHDGESLEIFVEKDMVALKKFSSISDLEDLAKTLVDTIYQSLKMSLLVSDRDTFIAVSANWKKKYHHQLVSETIENIMTTRKEMVEKELVSFPITPTLKEESSYAIYPIVVNGDAIGSVILLSTEQPIGDLEKTIALLTAQFLAKHIEE